MLDFVLFHEQPFQDFVRFLQQHKLHINTSQADDIWEVSLLDEVGDTLYQLIEQEYQRQMEVSQQLLEQGSGPDAANYYKAGVVLNLKQGESVYAYVDPALLARVMQVLTPQEFGDIVNAIVDAVENPDERSFCQIMRDEADS